MFERVHFIINPAAGQPEPLLHAINQVMYDSGIDWLVSVTTGHRDARSLTEQALSDGADCIVAYGGDGTAGSVINGMIGSDAPLALLHGGTGNALAHNLGIPADIREALKLVTGDHHMRSLDVGTATRDDASGHFVLRSSIGLQNKLLQEATTELKQQFGNFAYLMAGIRSLADSDRVTFRIELDDETFDAEGLTCIVANSATVGGAATFDFAPDVDPSDGQLDVFVIDADFDSVVSMMNSSLAADIDTFPNHWRGKSIKVTMSEPATVTLDGEPFADTPIEYGIKPAAVKVLTPAS